MLNKISWSSFAWILVLILIAYYLYVFVVYFRKEIFSFGSINKKSVTENNTLKIPINKDTSSIDKPSMESDKSVEDSFTLVHDLLEDLKELFLNASETKMIREELIQAIRSKLKTYPLIGQTDLVEDINNHLVQEAKDKCAMELYPEDLKQIWNS
jgi:hypothetical protein